MSRTTNKAASRLPEGPAWASWLGAIAIVLGVFLTAVQGNEWMTQYVMSNYMPDGGKPAAVCPEEELEEEGLALEECEYLLTQVYGLDASTPDWFPRTYLILAGVGTVLAFASVMTGGALVNYRPWAPVAAIAVFGMLAAVDMSQFIAVVNTGPTIRQLYLTNVLLWFLLHLLVLASVVAGIHGQYARRNSDELPSTQSHS